MQGAIFEQNRKVRCFAKSVCTGRFTCFQVNKVCIVGEVVRHKSFERAAVESQGGMCWASSSSETRVCDH